VLEDVEYPTAQAFAFGAEAREAAPLRQLRTLPHDAQDRGVVKFSMSAATAM
jgi:hypothetical protein